MTIQYLKEGITETDSKANEAKTRQIVEGILNDVETRGEEAIRELSAKFDNWSPENFRLSDEQIAEIENIVNILENLEIDILDDSEVEKYKERISKTEEEEVKTSQVDMESPMK